MTKVSTPKPFNPADALATVRAAVQTAYKAATDGKYGVRLDQADTKAVRFSNALKLLRGQLLRLGVQSSETPNSELSPAEALDGLVKWLRENCKREQQKPGKPDNGRAYSEHRAAFDSIMEMRAAIIQFGIFGGSIGSF